MLVENFYEGKNSEKPIIKGSGVNVLYFTNKCNLACTYCYEDLPGRPAQILSKEQIVKTVDSILERESPDKQTLFVLFGGEVTLQWENAVFMMEYTYSKKKNVHFNVESNGLMFRKDRFLKQYKDLKFFKLGLISLDISFDGVGNQERITHNGKESTSLVLEVFEKLKNNNIPFRIRYTIQNKNVKNLYLDLSKISQVINPERIITSVAWSTLTDDDILLLKIAKEKLRLDWKNNQISNPICELFCDMCDGCSEKKEIKTYYTDEGNVTTYLNSESTPKFHDFKEKENV